MLFSGDPDQDLGIFKVVLSFPSKTILEALGFGEVMQSPSALIIHTLSGCFGI